MLESFLHISMYFYFNKNSITRITIPDRRIISMKHAIYMFMGISDHTSYNYRFHVSFNSITYLNRCVCHRIKPKRRGCGDNSKQTKCYHPRTEAQGRSDQVPGEPEIPLRLRLRRGHGQCNGLQVAVLDSTIFYTYMYIYI